MKYPLTSRGAWHVCPVCNKDFFVAVPTKWSYKKDLPQDGRSYRSGTKPTYFHSYTCFNTFMKEYEAKKKKKKEEE